LDDGQLMKFQIVVANPPFSLDKWAMGFVGSGDETDFKMEASLDEIKENEYNLNIPRYVDTFEEEEPVDMDAVKVNIANIKIELAEVEVKMEKQLEELGL